MHLPAQGFSHLPASHVGDGVECQAVEQLIVVEQVLSYTIDDQMQQFVLFVEEEGHGEVADLLLRVLLAEMRLTASRWPKSTSHPRMYIYSSFGSPSAVRPGTAREARRRRTLQTYFFLWYPLRLPSTLVLVCRTSKARGAGSDNPTHP